MTHGDNNTGPRDVELFYEDFERSCNYANDGKGMQVAEQLVCLRQNLFGSRRTIFDNIWN